MSIFQIDEASQIQRSNMPKMTKDELQWVNIGVEWSKAKAKGMSAKAFADEKGIMRYAGEKVEISQEMLDKQNELCEKFDLPKHTVVDTAKQDKETKPATAKKEDDL